MGGRGSCVQRCTAFVHATSSKRITWKSHLVQLRGRGGGDFSSSSAQAARRCAAAKPCPKVARMCAACRGGALTAKCCKPAQATLLARPGCRRCTEESTCDSRAPPSLTPEKPPAQQDASEMLDRTEGPSHPLPDRLAGRRTLLCLRRRCQRRRTHPGPEQHHQRHQRHQRHHCRRYLVVRCASGGLGCLRETEEPWVWQAAALSRSRCRGLRAR